MKGVWGLFGDVGIWANPLALKSWSLSKAWTQEFDEYRLGGIKKDISILGENIVESDL